MRINLFNRLFIIMILTVFSLAAAANDHGPKKMDEVLIILTESSLQTQSMALVLGNAMADQGVKVHLLLCDSAGNLALKNHESSALKPSNITPGQTLRGLINKGAKVEVCALYLPNSHYTAADLMGGISPATPTDIAKLMLDSTIKVFTF